jgi:hypothetical protein
MPKYFNQNEVDNMGNVIVLLLTEDDFEDLGYQAPGTGVKQAIAREIEIAISDGIFTRLLKEQIKKHNIPELEQCSDDSDSWVDNEVMSERAFGA